MNQGIAALSFLGVTFGIVMSLLIAGRILRVRARVESPLKHRPYECGEEPEGMAWMQFHARYYLVALFFVLFDVEAVFLFPWSTVIRSLGTSTLIEVVAFVLVLMIGWLYGMRKGALKWQ